MEEIRCRQESRRETPRTGYWQPIPMAKRTYISKTLILGCLFLSLFFARVFACSYFPPTYTVGKTFVVKVSSLEGATYPGVRVILVREHPVSNSPLTHQKPSVPFQHVLP